MIFLGACDLFLLSGGSAMVAYYKSLSEISNIKTPRKRNVKLFVTQAAAAEQRRRRGV